MQPTGPLGDPEYAKLLAFRVGLRRFLSWSEEQAVAVGLTPTQHQLLLAIGGTPTPWAQRRRPGRDVHPKMTPPEAGHDP